MLQGNSTSARLGRGIIKVGEQVPLLRSALNAAYGHYFNRAGGRERIFRGIYPDFASATRDMPPHRVQGYDNDESAARPSRTGTEYSRSTTRCFSGLPSCCPSANCCSTGEAMSV